MSPGMSSTTTFNFTDLDMFARDTPHEELAKLRREAPVYWNPTPDVLTPGAGFWLITKHRDILQIEKDPTLFSSHHGLTITDTPPPSAGPAWAMITNGLAHLDPPEHPRHRQLIVPSFTPRAIAAMEARIRELAIEVVDRACELGDCDFAAEIAVRFPVSVVLGEVLGLPREDFARAIRWSDVVIAPEDPEFPRWAAAQVVEELYAYALSAFASRRKQPTNDVLSVLAHTRTADGTTMTEEMFARYFWSLAIGAFDTTASTISGGMQALLAFPPEHAKLLQDPTLVTTAVEEMFRWETPTIYFRRTATADTEIGGKQIRRGQRVVMCYASANRDEDAFSNPEVFDVGRRPNDHLAFGHGPHFCLGAGLARTQVRVLFEELVKRQLHVESTGPVRRARSNFQNRIKRMPVRISPVKNA